MPKPDAILFDLDGTLVDSLADIAAATNRVLRGLGLPEHPPEAYKAYVGQGARRLVERLDNDHRLRDPRWTLCHRHRFFLGRTHEITIARQALLDRIYCRFEAGRG